VRVRAPARFFCWFGRGFVCDLPPFFTESRDPLSSFLSLRGRVRIDESLLFSRVRERSPSCFPFSRPGCVAVLVRRDGPAFRVPKNALELTEISLVFLSDTSLELVYSRAGAFFVLDFGLAPPFWRPLCPVSLFSRTHLFLRGRST